MKTAIHWLAATSAPTGTPHPDRQRAWLIFESDENGEYRLFQLPPGKYTCDGELFRSAIRGAAVFIRTGPSAVDRLCNQNYESVIEVAPGSERTGVDVRMHTTAITQLDGHFSSDGVDWHGKQLRVLLDSTDPASRENLGAVIDQEKGTFHFARVFPGSYDLVAFSQAPLNPIGAIERIEVEDKPAGVLLTLAHSFDLDGTIEIIEDSDNSQKIPLRPVQHSTFAGTRVGFRRLYPERQQRRRNVHHQIGAADALPVNRRRAGRIPQIGLARQHRHKR